ncbi:MAG: hypothetical protein Q9181_006454, partial [Wetmoreana brouardii]
AEKGGQRFTVEAGTENTWGQLFDVLAATEQASRYGNLSHPKQMMGPARARQHLASAENKSDMPSGMLFPSHSAYVDGFMAIAFSPNKTALSIYDPISDVDVSTHRQRTQNYIKALESEVIRLRGSEGDLMQENKKLQYQVDSLLSTLDQAKIPLPAGLEGSLESPKPTTVDIDMPTTISYKADNLDHQRLHVDWPSTYAGLLPQASPAQATAAHCASTRDHFDSDWDMTGSQHKPLPDLPQDFTLATLSFNPTSENPMRVAAPDTLNTAEVAIDFVLALEHPCMSHLPHPTNPTSQDPSNHALLMSTHLMSRAPRPPQPDSSWTANGSILRQLLSLSSAINLEGEITPVEAWHRLRQHPGSATLDKSTIERIKGDLSTIVRCYGFGAVMDEAAFLFTLESILGPT